MRKELFILIVALPAVGLLLPGYGFADIVTLDPYADAFVVSSVAHSESYDGWNYGHGTNLLVDVLTATNGSYVSERRSYLTFDLTKDPSLAGITSANVVSIELTLYFTQIPNAGGTIYAYRSPDNWIEGTNTNGGTPIVAGSITGNNQPLDNTVGNKPPDSERIGSLTLGAGLLGGYHTIVLANGSWLDGDLSDGFLSVTLYDAIPSATAGAYYICSKEANACGHPSLVIVTQPEPSGVPEPATMLLLSFGLVGLAGVRRFRK
jgi:hypothetical protein